MDVIPVIDVRHGVAVHARQGQRDRYKPVETPLARGSDPVAVARGFLALFPFRSIYAADLDGIEGRGRHEGVAARLTALLPGVEFWIDGGISGDAAAARAGALLPVIGSESLADDDLERLRKEPRSCFALSLDFRGDNFVGPQALLDDAALWPERVIVMTLARVGAGEGPDLQRVAAIVARAGARRVYAAGGVRHLADLKALRGAGAAGALVATALHAGTITAGDLIEIAGR
jgi:phosphoribosylformimino-5-aminoimidazole carboxamide ribotide isomerase